ncbi:MAG: acyltransferase [Leptolyngbyaceae cyanobacterium bins.59]|nr:acyltransferase [Leptolyngbyaceae cyanobacterium bins.59]
MVSHPQSAITLPSAAPAKTLTKPHFSVIDALRGLAACWVFLYHVGNGQVSSVVAFFPQWLSVPLFQWGSQGVPVFFVLSGFVIAHSLMNAKINLPYFQRFTVRRLLRLNPPYYASIVLAIGLALIAAKAKGVPFAAPSLPQVLAHLLYLQEVFGLKNIIDVYWTLCLEVQFYLVFCALLGLTQYLKQRWNVENARLLVFAPLAIVSAFWPLGIIPEGERAFLFLPLWYGFFLGVFAYWTWKREISRPVFYLYAIPILIGSIVMEIQVATTHAITAILLMEIAQANRLGEWLKQSWLQFFGQISYSFYLIHVPISGATFFVGYKILSRSPFTESIMLLASFAICVICSYAFWYLFEKPSIAWSRRVKA